GIRDLIVTGVQTCALPIFDLNLRVPYGVNSTSPMGGVFGTAYPGYRTGDTGLTTIPPSGTIPNVRQHLYRATKVRGRDVAVVAEIGRASCRERVEIEEVEA